MTDVPTLEPAVGALVAASGETLALTAVTIDANVCAGAITLDTTATFVNDLAAPLEVTYLAPLPAGFAPVAASCTIAGTTVRADLVARAEAVRAYDDAVAAGRSAALAEQVGHDLFAFTVGNIDADEVATIRITVVGTADVDDGQATLRIPLSAGERYQPSGTAGRQPARRGPAARREPTATIIVRAHDVEPTVTTHDADYAVVDGATIVRVDDVALLGDVVVRWPAVAGWTAELSGDPERGWLTVTGTLAAPVERPARDIVILVDRSGSMGGWQMKGARSVASAIIDRLSAADRLCVLAFDTQLETAPGTGGFTRADARRRREVQAWLESVEARGGTELTRAFVTASGLVAGSGDRATIVIVTDAEIGDEQRCVAAIGMSDADVITVGVGSRVNRGLITAIAEASGGWSTIVESPERLDDAVGDVARRCAGPAAPIEHIEVAGATRVDWSGAHPNLYPGHQTVLRAEVAGAPSTVTVSGPGYRETISVGHHGSSAAHHLWARAKVATLLRGAVDQEPNAARIALDAGVLCRLTAFVAVDPSGRVLDALPRRVEVGHLDMAASGAGLPRFAAAPAAAGRGLFDPSRVRGARHQRATPMALAEMRPAPAPAQAAAMQSGAAMPSAARTFTALCAEIVTAGQRPTGTEERARLLGAWAEQVASFLGGPDAAAAKALAGKLANAVIGDAAAWAALVDWAARHAATTSG